MTQRILAALALLALTAGSPAAALAADEGSGDTSLRIEQLDASQHPEVTLTVSVPSDLNGILLDESAFTVTEDGVVRDVTVEPVPTDNLEVVLVLDASGSMQGEPLDAAKDAAQAFLDVLPSTVQVAVVSFASSPRVLSEFTTDRAETSSAVSSIEVAGETALHDGVLAAAGLFQGRDPARRTIVLLSDGGDTVSAAPIEDAIDSLLGIDVSFIAVELQSPENDGVGIARMAAATDGSVVPAEDPQALADVFETIATQISNQYLVSYESDSYENTLLAVSVSAAGLTIVSEAPVRYPSAPTTPPTVDPTPTPTPTPITPADPTPERPPVDVMALRDGSVVSLAWYQTNRALLIGAAAVFLAIAGIVLLGGFTRRSGVNYGAASAMAERLRAGKKGALTSITQGASEFAERSLKGDRAQGLNNRLDRAGVAMRPGEFIVMAMSFALGAAAIGMLFHGIAAAAAAAVMTLLFFNWRLSAKAAKRNKKFAEQLPDALQLMSGSLRAGFGFVQAIATVGSEVASPCGDEFRRVKIETQLGKDIDEALAEMAVRVDSEDFKWIVEAIEIHREVGGDLAEILDTVTDTIRDRNSIRRRITALSAEGKISGVVLGGMPFVLAIVIMFLNPTYLQELLDSAMGIAMIVGGLVAMVIGIVWMRKITNLKF